MASKRSQEQAEAHADEADVARLQAQVAELQAKSEKFEELASANGQQAETLKVRALKRSSWAS